MQPIIIVEDDNDDFEIIKEGLEELGEVRPVIHFEEGSGALRYLRATAEQPFLIISDVNMPSMTGIQLREEICKDPHLRKKSIPFVFLSTSDGKAILDKVYDLQVQGFFQKEATYTGIKTQLKMIIDYWHACKHPNRLE